jgi:thymidylate synthase
LTQNSIVVLATHTHELIDYIEPKQTIVVTNDYNLINNGGDESLFFETIDATKDIIITCIYNNYKVFIIGTDLYGHFIDSYDVMHLTLSDKTYVHDGTINNNSYNSYNCFFKPPSFKYSLTSFTEKYYIDLPQEQEDGTTTKTHNYRTLTYQKTCNYILDKYHCDTTYKSLAMKILNEGINKTDRTGTGTVSSFGNMIEFDISQYVPVLTTKKVFWKSVIKELLWFLRGDTDSNILSEQGVKIWEGNSSKAAQKKVGLGHLREGDCGANYSFQWRHFGAEYKTCDHDYTGIGIDQIAYIENLLKTDKHSRRIFLSAWNPADLNNTVLPPCHVSYQFYVDNHDNLSCHVYLRSNDFFLGNCYNTFSAAVLTYILAMRCNLKPKKLILSIGDTHIYNDHIEQIKQQLKRPSYSMPKLSLDETIKTKDWKDISIDDFELIGYFSHPTIKAHMSV